MSNGNSSNTITIPAVPTGPVLRRGPRQLRATVQCQPLSREAQRLAAAILEVLAGVRTPTEAAATLGMAVPRYYIWEQRALTGLVGACEPRPVGPGRSLRRQVVVLEKEVARLKQDCARQQALVRAAHRTVGLLPPPPAKPTAKTGGKAGERGTGKANGKASTKRRRKQRPVVRALKAVAAIRSAHVVEENQSGSSGAIPAEVLQRTPAADGGTGIPPAPPAAEA